jgi:hypothetical protein
MSNQGNSLISIKTLIRIKKHENQSKPNISKVNEQSVSVNKTKPSKSPLKNTSKPKPRKTDKIKSNSNDFQSGFKLNNETNYTIFTSCEPSGSLICHLFKLKRIYLNTHIHY